MAVHDYAHLGGRSSRTLDVGGKYMFKYESCSTTSVFIIKLFDNERRSVSIHRTSKVAGCVSGLWCCTGRGTRLTSVYQPVISIPNWPLWRKPTKNARRLANRQANDRRQQAKFKSASNHPQTKIKKTKTKTEKQKTEYNASATTRDDISFDLNSSFPRLFD